MKKKIAHALGVAISLTLCFGCGNSKNDTNETFDEISKNVLNDETYEAKSTLEENSRHTTSERQTATEEQTTTEAQITTADEVATMLQQTEDTTKKASATKNQETTTMKQETTTTKRQETTTSKKQEMTTQKSSETAKIPEVTTGEKITSKQDEIIVEDRNSIVWLLKEWTRVDCYGNSYKFVGEDTCVYNDIKNNIIDQNLKYEYKEDMGVIIVYNSPTISFNIINDSGCMILKSGNEEYVSQDSFNKRLEYISKAEQKVIDELKDSMDSFIEIELGTEYTTTNGIEYAIKNVSYNSKVGYFEFDVDIANNSGENYGEVGLEPMATILVGGQPTGCAFSGINEHARIDFYNGAQWSGKIYADYKISDIESYREIDGSIFVVGIITIPYSNEGGYIRIDVK